MDGGWRGRSKRTGVAAAVVATVLAVTVTVGGGPRPPAAAAAGPTASAATSSGFPDVPDDHPAAGDIGWMGASGIATGYVDGTFRPEAALSRQAIAAWLARWQVDPPPPACTAAPFIDVPVGHPHCAAIAWMASAGIAAGYADGTFRPGAPTSRQALAAFLARRGGIASPPPACTAPPFADVPVDHPFCAPIAWLVDEGVLPDDPAGALGPAATAGRGATAPLLAGADDRWWPHAVEVGLGLYHSCAVLLHGGLRCWGTNGSGQLGDGTTTGSAVPVPVVGIDAAVQVVGGSGHTCALLADGSVRCWGTNGWGQLGDGTTVGSITPVAVLGITDAVDLSSNEDHTCAALASGQVRCWGSNANNQLGGPSGIGPTTVTGIDAAAQVAAGVNHSCALMADTTVWCWGDGTYGQLGQGGPAGSITPLLVGGASADPELPGDVLSAGAGHTCTMNGGSMSCWGLNNTWQIGDGSRSIAWAPTGVGNMTTAVDIGAGGSNGQIDSHTCAVRSDQTVACWGANSRGQVGDGTARAKVSPVDVNGVAGAIAVDAGAEHSCAALVSGAVRCWGSRSEGQVGDGLAGATSATTAVPVVGLG